MRLFSARWVLPMIGPPIPDGAVVVDDGAVVAVGARAELRRAYPGVPETRADGALCPGLVNAHAHLELSSLGRAIPGGDGVVAWTRRLAARLAVEEAPDCITQAAFRAADQARDTGTAAIGDVGNGVTGWRALAHARLRGVFFHELVGSREARTGNALRDAAAERAAVPPDERPDDVEVVAAPHALYSVGSDLLRRIFADAATAACATSIHVAEDPDELRLLRDGTGAWADVLRAMGVAPEDRAPGLGPTAYLERLGAFATTRPPLLVHMVHADADDRRRARAAGATVVLCPRSNLHIGGRLPDVPAFIADDLRLAVGTDSLASVPDLSLWGELSALATRFPDVPPRTWLRAATAGGANALGLERLGCFAPGRRPGLLDVPLADNNSDGDPERALVNDPNPRVRWLVAA